MGESLIVRRAGGQSLKLPTLNSNLPSDVSIVASANGSASFSISITEAGNPAEYTYQWYKDGTAISGATGVSCTITGLTTAQTASIYCIVSNKAGSVQSRTATLTVQSYLPTYTYTGTHELINDANYNWRIKFKTSGTVNFSSLGSASSLDVFCVGGGANGPGGVNTYGPSGSGGFTTTKKSVSVSPNTNYTIVIGAGGPGYSAVVSSGATSGFGVSAAGGEQKKGGSGGCAYWNGGDINGYGDPGTDGGNGYEGLNQYGRIYSYGQGTTTREFGESSGTLYSSGGWGRDNPKNVAGGANTGDGGGSSGGSYPGRAGGSGIVVIRNHR